MRGRRTNTEVLEKLSVAERRSVEETLGHDKDQIDHKDDLALSRSLDFGVMKKSALRAKTQLEKDEDAVARNAQKDRLWKRVKELKDIFMPAMPTQEEMNLPTGTLAFQRAVEKNMRFEREFASAVHEYKHAMRRLEPEDPNAGNIERIRPLR